MQSRTAPFKARRGNRSASWSGVCSRGDLITIAVMTAGLCSLLAWTGAGPGSWQARHCAEFEPGWPSCQAIHPGKRTERLTQRPEAAFPRGTPL